MALRGAGQRDSRQFIQDLENLGVERGESVSTMPHQLQRRHAGQESARRALEIFADLLRSAASAGRPARRRPARRAARAAGDRRRAGAESDARAAPPPLSRSAGAARARARCARSKRSDLRRFAGYFERYLSAERHDPRRGRADRLEAARRSGRRLVWRLAAGRARRRQAGRSLWPKVDHVPHESNQTQIGIAYDSVPYRHPDYFQAWGRSACSAAA